MRRFIIFFNLYLIFQQYTVYVSKKLFLQVCTLTRRRKAYTIDISSRTCQNQIFRKGQRKIRDCVKRYSRESIKIPFEPVMEQEKIKKTKFFVGMPPIQLRKAKILPATQKKRVSEGKRASHFLCLRHTKSFRGESILFQ